MSAPRVVVTGGAGFVGSHLVDELVRRGDDVTVFDAARPPAGADVRFVGGDIRDPAAVAAAVPPGTDVVYHLAAVVGVDQYLARPLDVVDINVWGTRAVLEAADRAGARVVVASTSEVFGKNPAVPWQEDSDRVLGSSAADRWSYSASKGLSEHMTFAFARQRGLAATIVRYFNVYGPRQRPAYVVSRSIHRALNGRAMVLYDGGRQTRCFTFVRDAIAGTILAGTADKAIGEAFNLGSMVETPMARVVELIGALTGSTVPVEAVDTAQRLGPGYEDLARRVPDNGKARSVLGWECPTPLEDGLAHTVAWARANRWWLDQADSGAAGANPTQSTRK